MSILSLTSVDFCLIVVFLLPVRGKIIFSNLFAVADAVIAILTAPIGVEFLE